MLVALRLALESRGRLHDVAAGVLLAVAIAIKLTPALAALVLVLHLAMSAWRRAIAVTSGLFAGAILTLVAIPSLAVGPSESLRLLDTFVQRVVIERRVVGINAGSNQS
jgi:uncharacterized membrane protein